MSGNRADMKIDISRYKNFIFDFDGVIVDSLSIKGAAFGELFSDCGEDIVKKVMNYHSDNGGVSRYEKFRYFYKHFLNKNITAQIIDTLDKRYSGLVTEKVVSADFIKGADEFIKRLKKDAKACFIVSATPQEEIRTIARLKHVDTLFDEILGSPRTKDQNLELLLEKHGIKSQETVYFGDAKSDYEAARNNNINFIGIVNEASRELESLKGFMKMRDFTLIKEEK